MDGKQSRPFPQARWAGVGAAGRGTATQVQLPDWGEEGPGCKQMARTPARGPALLQQGCELGCTRALRAGRPGRMAGGAVAGFKVC